MLEFKEVKYVDEVPKNIECLLGADIGGTNSNFGFFQLTDDVLTLIFSMHVKSQQITQFSSTVLRHNRSSNWI